MAAERKAGYVSRAEWHWAALCACVLMTLVSVPYVVAWAAQTPEWRFSGFLIGVQDSQTYLAKMGQGARGAWLFTIPYSSEPQRGVFFYIFYLLLGKLAGPNPAAQIAVFHLARFVSGMILLLVSYRFLAEFLPRTHQRQIGLWLVALGGGMGWLLAIAGQTQWLGALPIDLYSPEAYSFLILFTLPHLAAARCFLLLGLLAFWRGRPGWAGLAFLGVGLIQPLSVIVAWALIGLHQCATLVARRSIRFDLRPALSAIGPSAPVMLYSAWVSLTNPAIQQWSAQNFVLTPHPLHYLVGYAGWLVPALCGARVLRRRNPPLAVWVWVWLGALPFLMYAPLRQQRRLIEGFQLPLVALTVLGLTVAMRPGRKWLTPVLMALSSFTALFLMFGSLAMARARAEPIFLSAAQLRVYAWVAQHAQPGQVGLSAIETGNALPVYTPLTAYLGHNPETLYVAEKLSRVRAFYQSATADTERLKLIADGRIAFVLFGPHERALGDFDPQTVPYLRFEFSADEYAVYSVETLHATSLLHAPNFFRAQGWLIPRRI